MSQIFFSLYCSGDKSLLSDFLRKWGWFHEYDVLFPKSLGTKLEFQKTETQFCRRKSDDYNEINILPLENSPCTVLLAKEKNWKRIFNTNKELSQRKVIEKKNYAIQNNGKLAI